MLVRSWNYSKVEVFQSKCAKWPNYCTFYRLGGNLTSHNHHTYTDCSIYNLMLNRVVKQHYVEGVWRVDFESAKCGIKKQSNAPSVAAECTGESDRSDTSFVFCVLIDCMTPHNLFLTEEFWLTQTLSRLTDLSDLVISESSSSVKSC